MAEVERSSSGNLGEKVRVELAKRLWLSGVLSIFKKRAREKREHFGLTG
jgi:hypothetical protein